MLARKGTVKDITHMFKTPGSSLSGSDKTRFDAINALVDSCTDEFTRLPVRADWISDCLKKCEEEPNPKVLSQVVFLLRRKIAVKPHRAVTNALTLIEALVKNGDSHVKLAIGTNFFLMEMGKLARKYGSYKAGPEKTLGAQFLELIQVWGEFFGGYNKTTYPNYVSLYFELKQEGFTFPAEPHPDRLPVIKDEAAGEEDHFATAMSNDIDDLKDDRPLTARDRTDSLGSAPASASAAAGGSGGGAAVAYASAESASTSGAVMNSNGFYAGGSSSSGTGTGGGAGASPRKPDTRPGLQVQTSMRTFDPFSQPEYSNPEDLHRNSFVYDDKISPMSSENPSPSNAYASSHGVGFNDSSAYYTSTSSNGGYGNGNSGGAGGGGSASRGGGGGGGGGYSAPAPASGASSASYGNSPHYQPYSQPYPQPVSPQAALLDSLLVSIQLLKDVILACRDRNELIASDIAKEISTQLKGQHKKLLETMRASPSQQMNAINEATIECLWGHDSVLEGKVPLHDVKIVLSRSTAASTAAATSQSYASPRPPSVDRYDSSGGYGGSGAGYGGGSSISPPYPSSSGPGMGMGGSLGGGSTSGSQYYPNDYGSSSSTGGSASRFSAPPPRPGTASAGRPSDAFYKPPASTIISSAGSVASVGSTGSRMSHSAGGGSHGHSHSHGHGHNGSTAPTGSNNRYRNDDDDCSVRSHTSNPFDQILSGGGGGGGGIIPNPPRGYGVAYGSYPPSPSGSVTRGGAGNTSHPPSPSGSVTRGGFNAASPMVTSPSTQGRGFEGYSGGGSVTGGAGGGGRYQQPTNHPAVMGTGPALPPQQPAAGGGGYYGGPVAGASVGALPPRRPSNTPVYEPTYSTNPFDGY